MTFLVADVGGTNSRFALADEDGLHQESMASFANAGYAAFEDVLTAYRADHADHVAACCIAIAGPVMGNRARLTNRDWAFDPRALSEQLGGAPVQLINDLVALGRAAPDLSEDVLQIIRPGDVDRRANGQTLVVGAGTGFNVCMAKQTPQGVLVTTEAEIGHSSMPDCMRAQLIEALGADADRFATVEDCLSGRGLRAVYQVLSGGDNLASRDVLTAAEHSNSAAAHAAVELMASLLGRYANQLIRIFLPFDGIFIAGGVARGILLSQARAVFLHAVRNEQGLAPEFERIPVSLICDDTAALAGCLKVLTEVQGLA